ncbi:MAG: hypothetical protein GWP10_11810, partial [Nitrospiraceae bacterium]|nr:hypothetical protein [Nitrospiraceae bacterium]
MTKPGLKSLTRWPWILLVLSIVLVISSCAIHTKPHEISYVEKKAIPRRIAVLPARIVSQKAQKVQWPIDPKSEKGMFITGLVRSVIQNQLSGKGYSMLRLDLVDKKLASSGNKISPEKACDLLGVDGLIYPVILSASMVSAVAFNLYKIEAKVKMVNKDGKELGTWSESASKRKIALPTGPVGAAATVVGAIIEESAKKQMRLVIYDWGWKIAQFIPDSPYGKALPQVVSVDTNIDKGTFVAGDQVIVDVTAEKDLTCTFDLGNFKKGLPMPYAGGGTYKGIYVVQKGDHTSTQTLTIHLVRPNGTERVWLETGGTITVDAIAPPAPEKIKAEASRQGISLSWGLPEAKDLKEFIVERSKAAVGKFSLLARTEKLTYLDAEVSQGSTYYYRVRSVDRAGNRSSQDNPLGITVPFFDEVKLPRQLTGHLVTGVYLVNGEAVIPQGEIVKIGPGSTIKFSSGSSIIARGSLKVTGSSRLPTVFEGDGWKGIVVGPSGRVEISNSILRGCAPCIMAMGGNLEIDSVALKGKRGDGIIINGDTVFGAKNVEITGCKRGLFLNGGKDRVEESTITKNDVGIKVKSGTVELVNNNIFKNLDKDIISPGKLVLEDNYLGSASVKKLNLDGDILVKSLLDAPFPYGRKVILIEEGEITPANIKKHFQRYKARGKKAFTERRYGDAYQYFTKALRLKEDREIYLYLAYTQMALGETKKLERTLKKGIEAFPYEVRLYQVYVKYLTAKGKTKEALHLLGKALKMNPNDENLNFMKQYLER